jgi:hypothetical protein
MSYKIETDVQGIVKPNEELKGKVFVLNEDKKEQKLKYVGANVAEHCLEKRYNETFKEYRDEDVGKVLKKVDIFQGGKIGPGETMEFDFLIKLPTLPGRRHKDWHVSIDFIQKTGLFKTGGKDVEDAKCVLPVPGSDRVPSIGNLQSMK